VTSIRRKVKAICTQGGNQSLSDLLHQLNPGAAGMDGLLPPRGGQGDVRVPAALHLVACRRLASPETPEDELEDPASALLHYGVVAARRGDGAFDCQVPGLMEASNSR